MTSPRHDPTSLPLHSANSAPGACPVCGAITLVPSSSASTLLAVCDVLVRKALEQLGKYLVRASRPRFRQLGNRPWLLAHTLWTPDDAMVSKALRGAWDVVPALLDIHGCCGITSVQVVDMLNVYVHDLAVTGMAHDISLLHARFVNGLNLPVPEVLPDRHDHDSANHGH